MARKSATHTVAKKTQPKKTTKTPSTVNDPVFAQPSPTPDPTNFRDPVTDQPLKEVGTVEPFPVPRGGAAEPVLQFADTLGSQGAARVTAIQKAGQIVFHTVGDTGSTKGPSDAIAGGGQDGDGLYRGQPGQRAVVLLPLGGRG